MASKTLIFILILLSYSLQAKQFPVTSTQDLSIEKLPVNKTTLKRILKSDYIFSDCQVESFKQDAKKRQNLHFNIIGLHKNSCQIALRTLSQYENFVNMIDFINRSTYDEKSQFIFLGVEHSLFPVKLTVSFKIPRIKKPGTYPYTFPKGFLKDLKGNIRIFEHEGRCLFWTDAHWEGPDTGYLDSVLAIFSQTASRIGMEKLFRMSRF